MVKKITTVLGLALLSSSLGFAAQATSANSNRLPKARPHSNESLIKRCRVSSAKRRRFPLRAAKKQPGSNGY